MHAFGEGTAVAAADVGEEQEGMTVKRAMESKGCRYSTGLTNSLGVVRMVEAVGGGVGVPGEAWVPARLSALAFWMCLGWMEYGLVLFIQPRSYTFPPCRHPAE